MSKPNTKSVENVSNSVTEKSEFKPTPHMRVWLDSAIRLKTNVITQIAQDCGVARETWYEWLNKHGETFEDWYYEAYEKKLRLLRPEVDRIAWKYADRGSYNHLELMAKRTGAVQDKPQNMTQVNVQGNSITFANFKNEPDSKRDI